jgi:5-formyltetrahydrofolate cyclo-ligase
MTTLQMQDWDEIRAWRKQLRAELIARREAIFADERRTSNERITRLLEEGFPVLSAFTVGFCWPYKGEFDSRFAVRHFREQGAVAALPAVVGKGSPLEFRKWWPGAPIEPGVFGIPVPQTEVLVPDAAIVPMNAFDESGYRLGYAGGYFDRTLDAIRPRPISIGVSYEFARIPTLYPQPWDIPMDFVVTEAGIHAVEEGGLQPIEPADCANRAAQIAARRGLPRAGHKVVVPPAPQSYSSPPCYAREVAPDYFGEQPSLPTTELLCLLNMLLEAERAGVKVLAEFLTEYERGTPAWDRLRALQRDEADNCAILADLVRNLGGVPSSATGDFVAKALAVEGCAARLAFLNRGQGWVARKIAEVLPRIEDDLMRDSLRKMHASHLKNIEACEALRKSLE